MLIESICSGPYSTSCGDTLMDRVPVDWRAETPSQADLNKFGSGKHGYKNSDSLLAIVPTICDQDLFDAIQESIVRTIEGAGLQPDGSQTNAALDQLYTAIIKLIISFQTGEWIASQADTVYGGAVRGFVENGSGTIVAVGARGVQRSTNAGVTWSQEFAGDFFAVAWDGSQFILVGVSGGIFTSPTGVTWTARTAADGFTETFKGIAYDGTGLLTAVGASGEIQTSSDGIAWTARTADASYTGDFNDVHFAESKWVIVGNAREIQTSSDATTWTHRDITGFSSTVNFLCVWEKTATAGENWLLGSSDGNIASSTDGFSWTKQAFPGGQAVSDIEQGTGTGADDRYVAARFATANAYFTDVVTGVSGWGLAATPPTGIGTAIGQDGTTFYFGGQGGEVATSDNANSWTNRMLDALFNGAFRAIAQGSGLHVVVGDSGEIQISSSAIIWARQVAAGSFADILYGVAYNQSNLFVAVGESGEIQSSPDGIVWTKQTQDGSYAGDFRAVFWDVNNSLFVAVGTGGEIQTSSDGITWAKQTQAGAFAGTFFAGDGDGSALMTIVGSGGEIQTSADGVTWAAKTPDGSYADDFRGATHKSGLWTIVGDAAEIQTSPNGTAWTNRSPAGGYGGDFFDVFSTAGKFTAIGSGGEIQASVDGVTWSQDTAASGFTGTFRGGVFNGLERVIVGDTAEIQHSV